MIKIAICDDNNSELNITQSFVSNYMVENNLIFDVHSFSSSVELSSAIDNGMKFDIFLLDVIMPDMNGIEIANKINSNLPKAKIVFLSTSAEYAVDSYSVNAFYYLLKPFVKENFDTVFDKLLHLIANANANTFLKIKTNNDIVMQDVNSITYCIFIKRQVNVHLFDDPTVIVSTTLREPFAKYLEVLFNRQDFACCNYSCIVNLEYIKQVNSSDVILKDGTILPISRTMKKDFNSAFFNYQFGKSDNAHFSNDSLI